EAYTKVTQRDLEQIERLKTDGNPENYKSIYNLYVNMNARQEAIKPLLPLRINGKEVAFRLNDYTNDIVAVKAELLPYEYDNAVNLLSSNNKLTLREAYRKLKYIENLDPDDRDVRNHMDEAYFNGSDIVFVSIENQTRQIIPGRLKEDLLNFDTYRLVHFQKDYNAQP